MNTTDKIDPSEIHHLYLSTKMSLADIAVRYGKKRQWISFVLKKYLDDLGIEYTDTTVWVCKVCGEKKEEKKTINCKVRKERNRTMQKRYKCKKCEEGDLVHCYNCRTVGKKEDFIFSGGNSYKCVKCNKESTYKWKENNRDRWNMYLRDWRKKRKEAASA